ncbi:hypothetical protein [Aeromicrobium sp. UC242_57]
MIQADVRDARSRILADDIVTARTVIAEGRRRDRAEGPPRRGREGDRRRA